jgi:hypothetical protein
MDLFPEPGKYIFSDRHGFRVGKEGCVFLVKALMDIEALYDDHSPETIAFAEKWVNAISKRLEMADAYKYQLKQIIIPEKISFFNELFYKNIARKSLLMQHIEESLCADQKLSSGYISIYDLLRPLVYCQPSPIPRIDTHLTSFGAYKIISAILESFDMKVPEINFISEDFKTDIGQMLTGGTVLENDWAPVLDGWESEPKLIDFYDPPDSGHFTTRRVWENSYAPHDCRVLAVGNSYFGWGLHSRELSWWGSRLFTQFHFIWGHHFDYEEIKRVKPDYVIGQTIERYLGTPAWA